MKCSDEASGKAVLGFRISASKLTAHKANLFKEILNKIEVESAPVKAELCAKMPSSLFEREA